MARLQLLLPRQIIITNRNVTIKLAKPGRVVCKTSNQAEAVHSWIALVRYFPLMMTTTTTRQPFRRLPCHCTGWCIVRSLLLIIIRRASLYPVYQSFAVAIILSIHYTYLYTRRCLPFATDHSKRRRTVGHGWMQQNMKQVTKVFTLFQQYFAICCIPKSRHMISTV